MTARRFLLVSGVVALLAAGCRPRDQGEPIPKTHPGYAFYAIAREGPTNLETCESYGGREIYPVHYEVIKSLDRGVFTIREKSTGRYYLGIAFAEGGLVKTVKTCCFKADPPGETEVAR